MTDVKELAEQVRTMLDRMDRAKGKGGYPSAMERYAMRQVLDLLLSLEGEFEGFKTDTKETEAFFIAKVADLEAQIKAKDEALERAFHDGFRHGTTSIAGRRQWTPEQAWNVARSAYEGLDRLPESPSGDAFRAAGEVEASTPGGEA